MNSSPIHLEKLRPVFGAVRRSLPSKGEDFWLMTGREDEFSTVVGECVCGRSETAAKYCTTIKSSFVLMELTDRHRLVLIR